MHHVILKKEKQFSLSVSRITMLMAETQNPLTGQMSGTVANFVTSTLGSKNLVRSKAFNPRNANTESQQLQRSCFTLIVEEYQSWGGVTDLGFPENSDGQSAYNLFMAANLPGAIDKSGAEPVIVYSKLQVSKGSLPNVVVSNVAVVAAGISISYQTNVRIPKVNATDEVVAIAKTNIGEILMNTMTRGAETTGTIVIDYPGIVATDVKCCYLFVRNADGSKASKSVYIPIV